MNFFDTRVGIFPCKTPPIISNITESTTLLCNGDCLTTASELILEWGVEEARPEGQRAGDGVLGEGTASPSPPTMGFAGAL